MSKTAVLAIIVLLLLGSGAFFLVTWEIPAPTSRVEQELADDCFPY